MRPKIKGLHTVLALGFSALAAMALTMDFAPRALSAAAEDSSVLALLEGLRLGLDGSLVQSTVIAAALFMLWRWVHERGRRGGHILLDLICLAVALVWLMTQGYLIDGSLAPLRSDMGQVGKSLVYLLGSVYLLCLSGRALELFIDQGRDLPPAGEGRIAALWKRHGFLCPFLALMALSLPALIMAYPGRVTADSWNQIGMYFGIVRPDWGIYPFTSHYPVANTLFIGSIIALGRALVSAQFGLFLASFTTALIYALSCAYALRAMAKLGSPRWLYWAAFLLFAFCPYVVYEYASISKDGLYAWMILLFATELGYMLHLGWDYWKSKGHMAVLALSILMAVLMRNNGLYVIAPTAAVLCLVGICRRREGGARLKSMLAGLLLPLIAAVAVNSVLMRIYDVEKGSIREALSLPIQQTARYVRDYGDEVTEEEREAISAVLDYEDMAQDYYPMESDPVKDKWDPEAGTEELLAYLKTWIAQGLKHPLVYIQATVEQNYPLVYPFREGPMLRTGTLHPAHMAAAQELGIEEGGLLPRLDNVRDYVNVLLFYLPVTGLAFGIPMAVLVLAALCCFAIGRRRWAFLLAALPLVLSVGIVILSPGISGNPRYAYPILYSLPLILCCWYRCRDGKIER